MYEETWNWSHETGGTVVTCVMSAVCQCHWHSHRHMRKRLSIMQCSISYQRNLIERWMSKDEIISHKTSKFICDPIAKNESHWYSIAIQNATIFNLQVKTIDFRFSSKSGASGIIQFENSTFNGQMWCFVTVSGILNCNCFILFYVK